MNLYEILVHLIESDDKIAAKAIVDGWLIFSFRTAVDCEPETACAEITLAKFEEYPTEVQGKVLKSYKEKAFNMWKEIHIK